jgi:hypothetical protein
MFKVGNKQITPSDGFIDQRFQNTVTSIFENRLPIFLPISKLHQSRIKKTFDTNDNVVIFDFNLTQIEVRGRLVTQRHKSLLESMLSYQKHLLTDESFYVKFKIHNLLKTKLNQKNPNDYDTFKKQLKELKDINLVIHIDDTEIGFGFIDDYIIDKKTGEYKIKFTRVLSQIWMNESLITYKKTNASINQITNMLVQSVIRYMITYNNLQIKISTLLNEKLNFKKIFSKAEQNKKLIELRDSFLNEDYKLIYQEYGITFDREHDNIVISRSESIFLDIKKGKTLTSKLS